MEYFRTNVGVLCEVFETLVAQETSIPLSYGYFDGDNDDSSCDFRVR